MRPEYKDKIIGICIIVVIGVTLGLIYRYSILFYRYFNLNYRSIILNYYCLPFYE